MLRILPSGIKWSEVQGLPGGQAWTVDSEKPVVDLAIDGCRDEGKFKIGKKKAEKAKKKRERKSRATETDETVRETLRGRQTERLLATLKATLYPLIQSGHSLTCQYLLVQSISQHGEICRLED
ncbi:hypothetical protein ElyMa_001082700 [Elysia marginata]|uniref:Uncharacterized protein n=1 Tax=Elysia marginata TaxID=1093978 RepID=A0AAV4HT35_9GAST|nr:hypothetical protein ElyMa_001082700 [Elysia marginata]